MKPFFQGLCLMLALSSIVHGASLPQGFVLFTEPPSQYVHLHEFSSYVQNNWRYSTFSLPDGRSEQLQNSGIIKIVKYPAPQLTTDEAEASTAIQTIQELQRKYPQADFRTRFNAALTQWQNAAAIAKRTAKQTPQGTPAHLSKTVVLNVGGTRYERVSLTSLDGENAGITHSGGVTKVSIESLNKEQIVALNSTATSTRIDPEWKLKKQQKIDAEKQWKVAEGKKIEDENNRQRIIEAQRVESEKRRVEEYEDLVNAVEKHADLYKEALRHSPDNPAGYIMGHSSTFSKVIQRLIVEDKGRPAARTFDIQTSKVLRFFGEWEYQLNRCSDRHWLGTAKDGAVAVLITDQDGRLARLMSGSLPVLNQSFGKTPHDILAGEAAARFFTFHAMQVITSDENLRKQMQDAAARGFRSKQGKFTAAIPHDSIQITVEVDNLDATTRFSAEPK